MLPPEFILFLLLDSMVLVWTSFEEEQYAGENGQWWQLSHEAGSENCVPWVANRGSFSLHTLL